MINMKTIYTVYQLNEKTNKLGNPYIGFTENLIRRSKVWKRELKLDYTPELIPLYTDTSAQRAFDWEQDKRVENGWRRERPLSHLRKISKKGGIRNGQLGNFNYLKTKEHQSKAGKLGGKKAVQSGQLASVSSFETRSKGGKIANAKKVKCLYCDFISNPGNVGLHMKMYCKLKPQL